jgi:hypothetical protein
MYKGYKVGEEFEDTIVEKIGSFSIKTWKGGFKSTINTLLDTQAGTDFILLGVPMDVTLDYASKRQTKMISRIEFDFGGVTFGIRYGNGRVKFDTPVLVLGFDVVLPKQYLVQAVDEISHNFSDILETGMDLYFENVEEA